MVVTIDVRDSSIYGSAGDHRVCINFGEYMCI
jgi:hypothetical protein